MGALFTFASGTGDIATAAPDAVAAGMQVTFAIAGLLILVALAIAVGTRAPIARSVLAEDPS